MLRDFPINAIPNLQIKHLDRIFTQLDLLLTLTVFIHLSDCHLWSITSSLLGDGPKLGILLQDREANLSETDPHSEYLMRGDN